MDGLVAVSAIVVVLVASCFLLWAIGRIPGKIARERRHRSADAIDLLAWIGLLFFGIGWLIALVWAHSENNRRGDSRVVNPYAAQHGDPTLRGSTRQPIPDAEIAEILDRQNT